MTRIIEDWSEAAIKEIKHADDIGETAWTLIPRINSHSGEYKNIGRMILNCEDENTIVQDISDYFCRDAKFEEAKPGRKSMFLVLRDDNEDPDDYGFEPGINIPVKLFSRLESAQQYVKNQLIAPNIGGFPQYVLHIYVIQVGDWSVD
ncbi:hypothetical protein [Companilactobacillus nodensis]|uniref:Uncharacterized protein n=1 Tax=Companilactobacillus nodensis DSM 19682 = JCM 14932 = NBRC 107160 TaxID=1423775 RepID=A0A0R1K779_9LACO|nr:hypothetical protein [Companilactobacillus nodensis]KRK79469.1 hypothetical protein FD03_GL000599 [Companilactobacillus nodensis DSM 19682 = JCM 14932 = NBRC 107160]